MGCIRCAIRRLSAIPPHTHPPPLTLPPRRVLITRSRPPPNGLRQPRTHPRRPLNWCAEGQRAPPPPPITYMGCATPAPRLTHPHLLPHTPLCTYAVGAGGAGGGARKWGHLERGAVQPERRTARGCTASAVSSHARKGWRTRGWGRTGKGGAQPRERLHANGGVCARGWCSPACAERWEDGPRAKRKGVGTLSPPSRPINRLRKIHVK
ncbi:hypothetical protein BJY52DRAFT_1336190 [Lactarius psammicola]|nr:hypothetical protein BJY52DRAFT_1336190 [Lactarius psammicola]